MSKKETKTEKKEVVITPELKTKEIEKEVLKLQKEFPTMSVKSAEDATKVTEWANGLNTRLKRVEELRKSFVAPLNDHVKMINNMFKMQSEPLEKMLAGVKRLLSDFYLEEQRKADIEDERKRKIREAANAKREEKGQSEIIIPVAQVARVDSTLKTSTGKSTATKVWQFEIINEDAIPREFCISDDRKIREAIKNGAREIAGVRVYEDYKMSLTGR